ncbi:hypothetical protein DFH28DRAFT_896996 [Melampsora americana]|nr:hypothetical protein DFH28DRAFT_896996 [Melampsora americana]
MPARRQVETFKPTARMIEEATFLLDYLHETDFAVKDLLLTLILGVDSNDSLATLRRYWGFERGWPSTVTILMAFKKVVVTKSLKGQQHWDRWILSEAMKIVAAESSPRSVFGPPTPAHKISHFFFGIARTAERYAALKKGTGFLWHLIRGTIARNQQLPGVESKIFHHSFLYIHFIFFPF